MDVDAIDRKILYVLGKNARLSHAALAKALHLSREKTSFRVKRLIDNGYLQGTVLNINPEALGLVHTQVYLRVQSASVERLKELEQFLRSEPHVILALNTIGRWNYIVTILANNLTELGRVSDKLTTHFPEIVELAPLFILDEQAPGWAMLPPADAPLPTVPTDASAFTAAFARRASAHQTTIDRIDQKLLVLLAQDTRVGILDIAKHAGISYRTARAKIIRLISTGVIARFDVVGSISKLGYIQRSILLTLKNITTNEAKARTLFESLRTCSRYWRTFGMAQFRLNIYARTAQEFATVIETIRKTFGEELLSLDSLENISQIKRIGFTEYQNLLVKHD